MASNWKEYCGEPSAKIKAQAKMVQAFIMIYDKHKSSTITPEINDQISALVPDGEVIKLGISLDALNVIEPINNLFFDYMMVLLTEKFCGLSEEDIARKLGVDYEKMANESSDISQFISSWMSASKF